MDINKKDVINFINKENYKLSDLNIFYYYDLYKLSIEDLKLIEKRLYFAHIQLNKQGYKSKWLDSKIAHFYDDLFKAINIKSII